VKSYDELFDERGSAYDLAMRRFPNARDQEFEQIIKRAEIKPSMIVADVPAGGGYLQKYLPKGSQWLGHEPCASFTNHGQMIANEPAKPLLPFPWENHVVDAVLTLAGIHHIENKLPFFIECRRVCKKNGILVVSDVAAKSKTAKFLDGYVGENNTTGHEGIFLDESTLSEITEAGWKIHSCELVDFHWVFSSKENMSVFCHGLFDLCKSSPKDTQMAIENQLGVSCLASGEIGMNWSLLTITAKP
jgi:SAM-dependent methyltransferase